MKEGVDMGHLGYEGELSVVLKQQRIANPRKWERYCPWCEERDHQRAIVRKCMSRISESNKREGTQDLGKKKE